VKGRTIGETHTPAAFNVLVNHLRGLGLDVLLGRGATPEETI
jgi:DNA-directed RNA polymerase beta subunit